MSDFDDLEEIAEQLRPGGNNPRSTKKQRDAFRRATLNAAASQNSPAKQQERAMDRRLPIVKEENQH